MSNDWERFVAVTRADQEIVEDLERLSKGGDLTKGEEGLLKTLRSFQRAGRPFSEKQRAWACDIIESD